VHVSCWGSCTKSDFQENGSQFEEALCYEREAVGQGGSEGEMPCSLGLGTVVTGAGV